LTFLNFSQFFALHHKNPLKILNFESSRTVPDAAKVNNATIYHDARTRAKQSTMTNRKASRLSVAFRGFPGTLLFGGRL
jgi:hypothetical protein